MPNKATAVATRFGLPFLAALFFLGNAQLFAAEVPFKAAKISIVFNASQQSVGLQVSADGDAWKKLTIAGPNGKVFNLKNKGKISSLGLAQLGVDSNKPAIADMPLDQFFNLFPEGDYNFTGLGMGGDTLKGTVTLTHNLPDAAVINSPGQGQVVDPSNTVVGWAPVTTPAGIQMAAYRVIITQDNSTRMFVVDLSKNANNLRLPSKFLLAGATYHVEVRAIEVSGNQTISEVSFSTP